MILAVAIGATMSALILAAALGGTAAGTWAAVRHTVRAAKALLRDARLPRWLRPLIVLGVLPIPGPADELIALLALAVVFLAYRPLVRDAWAATEARAVR